MYIAVWKVRRVESLSELEESVSVYAGLAFAAEVMFGKTEVVRGTSGMRLNWPPLVMRWSGRCSTLRLLVESGRVTSVCSLRRCMLYSLC